ncbi:MAG: YhcH/YjgK/YiaL family protein [Bacteroidota bacterium]|nr:YhcH/YjgK/YiaL family protein [Bacteroidota bacterium]
MDNLFEAHWTYIDIQYIIEGEELMKVAPNHFLIFFPSDAHKPNLKVQDPAKGKKLVVKVRVK